MVGVKIVCELHVGDPADVAFHQEPLQLFVGRRVAVVECHAQSTSTARLSSLDFTHLGAVDGHRFFNNDVAARVEPGDYVPGMTVVRRCNKNHVWTRLGARELPGGRDSHPKIENLLAFFKPTR